MNLLYGEDKYFIGAVKFFDVNKDFGFIASNNCNMPSLKYKQDFYINSSSFIEDEAKKEGRVVVFQVERQENGKKRAVNVRRISNSDEDMALVLSYYGEHEYIEYKDNRTINLYNHISKPRQLVAEKVRSIIVNDDERSPEKTLQHFKFFIEHYKQEKSSKDCYIFDRDFSKEEKNIWVSLFSVLTDEERFEILKCYPSACRYFNDTTLLNKWLDFYLNDKISLEDIKLLVDNYSFLPDEFVQTAKGKTQIIIDNRIKGLYSELSQKNDIIEDDLNPKPANFRIRAAIYRSDSESLLRELHAFLSISENDYTVERKACLESIRYKKFKTKLSAYVTRRADSYSSEELFNSFSAIEDDKDKCLLELENASEKLIEKFIEEEDFGQVDSVLRFIANFDHDYVLPYKERLYGPIHDSLHKILVDSIRHPDSKNKTFFRSFHAWSPILEVQDINRLEEEFGKIILQDADVFTLTLGSDVKSGWLPIEKVLDRFAEIISDWTYKDFVAFIDKVDGLFGNHITYNDLIVRKALTLIKDIPINKWFSKEESSTTDEITIQRRNCSFLKKVKSFVENASSSSKELWDNYVNTRSPEERIILYNNDVVSDLPDSIISDIVNRISLNDVLAESNRWYNKPQLGNQDYKKILTETKVNLFPIILSRLSSMQLNEETIPLAVLLAELMSINKPSTDDYYTYRDWNANFSDNLKRVKESQPNNLKLGIILWAVHFKSAATIEGLKDTFTFLPPYLQIRAVKKLFQLISQGKLSNTAEGLYNLITSGNKKICFPLEIAFAYLIRREKDPSATLDNSIMLQLLDGRDDHPEWIGIRQLTTECNGRWQANDLHDNRSNYKRGSYFNGIIKEGKDDCIIVYVPNKMVDEHGNLQNYNNKYFTDIQELIKISYDNSEYQKATVQNGIAYKFNQSHKIGLFAVARAYNMKYNRLDNYVEFKRIEAEDDVFCECRAADALDNWSGVSFYWCGNKPCFRQPLRYMLDSEWERYTILDFMRILHIPTDYTNRSGKVTRYGHYIILSAYLKSFAKFYEHLKCRECGKLMRPLSITNFASRAVNQFKCADERCLGYGKIVYLNHCFNKQKCNATIDSRDSKQCPNDQYICPECGACCSTENFRRRISHLQMTGGDISKRLIEFVQHDLGHWEKQEFYCYKCGQKMTLQSTEYVCPKCNTRYNH